MTQDAARIELWWLPLGAGGWFVRLKGRMYEAVHALLERRRPLDLYHSALVVSVPEGRFVVENCWPIPDGDGVKARGVVVQARWPVNGLPDLEYFGMRSGTGGTGPSPTPGRPWPAPSC